MSKPEELGLNEALISLNKTGTRGVTELYYQTTECFGCPLEKLDPESASEYLATYKVSTRYNLQLEIRKDQQPSGEAISLCKLDNLYLNTHAHYSISVSDRNTSGSDGFDCKWQTLDSGDCLLCPFAILISVIFGFMLIEWLWLRFFETTTTRRHSKLVSTGSAVSESASNDEPEMNEQSTEHGLAPIEQDLESSAKSNRLNVTSHAVLKSSKMGRVQTLDAFRGLTIAAMIFVNYGGAGYAIWDHKPWNGITLADFVFPFFVFSMGCSIALSVRSQLKRAQSGPNALLRLSCKIARRSLLLAFIGLCLNSQKVNYERADGLAQLRLTGVLQRFAFSYFNVAMLYAIELTLARWIKAQSLSQVPYLSRLFKVLLELMLACQCLSVYIYITYYFQYSDNCPAGYTGPGGMSEGGKYANCTGGAAAWLDRLVLGEKHLYQDHEVKQVFHTQVTHDPEGLLGYTTSILLTLLGLQCGKIMSASSSSRSDDHRGRLLALGRWCVALALCCPIASVIPVNKRLWSLSFVLVTGLAANLLIGLIYLALDVYWSGKRPSLLVRLLISAGKNSIFLYVAHSLVHTMLPWWFPVSNPSSHLQLLLRLTWSLLVWLLIAHLMALKSLFIRV